jgi:ATP-dependent exoDNAse (exonuclease V) alpha subunit
MRPGWPTTLALRTSPASSRPRARQHRPPGAARVENGTRGEITRIGPGGQATLRLDGSGRRVTLVGEDLEILRLAYAQHIYRQQGATVDRAVVVTGGWQTSKESAYVEASRARYGTDWYVARDELGSEGQDTDRTTRLAQHMRHSRAQTPSLTYQELPDPTRPDWLQPPLGDRPGHEHERAR